MCVVENFAEKHIYDANSPISNFACFSFYTCYNQGAVTVYVSNLTVFGFY